MSATIQTLGRQDIRGHAPGVHVHRARGASATVVRRVRAMGVRRAIGCFAGAFVGGGIAWNWATLLAGALHVSWIGPVAGLSVGLWLTLLIATIDADEPAT